MALLTLSEDHHQFHAPHQADCCGLLSLQSPVSSLQSPAKWSRTEVALLLLVLLVAAFFRFYDLRHVPPGLNFDEAGNGATALDVLRGHPQLFWDIGGGKEPLWVYLLAGVFAVFGATPFTLRATAATVGTATVLATFLVVRELFAGHPLRPWLAALTGLGLATTYWPVNLNRLGLRGNLLPLFAALTFLFLWRGLRRGRTRDFVVSGVLLGGSLYAYTGARFLPLVPLVFFAFQWAAATLDERKPLTSLLRRHWRSLLLAAAVALAVFAPLGVYFLFHPQSFAARASGISIFNPARNKGDLWGTLLHYTLTNLGAFGFTSDHKWLYNLPGRPTLDPVMAALFWLGVAVAAWRARRPAYGFCLVWWVVMLLPSILAPERVTHFLRISGAAPVAFVFPALAMVTGWQLVARRVRRRWWGIVGVVVALGLFARVGYATFHDYFFVWARGDELYLEFDLYAVELAQQMTAETDPDAVFILPTDIRAGQANHHFTVDFLYRGPTPYHYISVDEDTLFRDLTAACRGRSRVRMIRWKADKQLEADPKEIIPFLLEKYGEKVDEQSFMAFDVVTYRLDSADTDFTAAPDFRPVGVTFGPGLTLVEAAYGDASDVAGVNAPRAPAGGWLWVELRWRDDGGPLAEDYKVSLRVVDAQGGMVAQRDRTIWHNWHEGTSRWQAGQAATDYYLLPAPTVPGTYRLQAIVYSPSTLQPLPITAGGQGVALVLGEVAIQ